MKVDPRDVDSITIGDTLRLTIVHPNTDEERFPGAKFGGEVVFVRFPDDYDGEIKFGDTVIGKVADINNDTIDVAAIGHEGEDVR